MINITSDEYEIITVNATAEDFETLMFDHNSNYLYMISKNHNFASANIYKFPANTPEGSIVQLTSLGTIPYEWLVAGDITFDGTKILLRQISPKKGHMININQGQSVEDALLNNNICEINLTEDINEEQGEAICGNYDSSGFYTTSENADSVMDEPINFYPFI